jgi:hypothetical protein
MNIYNNVNMLIGMINSSEFFFEDCSELFHSFHYHTKFCFEHL